MKKRKTISGLKIIFIFILIAGLFYLYFLNDVEENKFRITKQVCENASIILGEREFNFISPWTYIQPRVMEADTMYCNYLLRTNFGIYNEEIIDCEYTLINISCVNISKQVKLYDNSTYLLDGYEEKYCEYQYLIESTTEVRGEQYYICHKEEVNEIKTNKGELNISDYITGEISSIPDCAYRINDTYIICLEAISKQDLTTEWLDENAECKEWCSKKWDLCVKGDNYFNAETVTDSKCSQYELGNYTIEVLR